MFGVFNNVGTLVNEVAVNAIFMASSGLSTRKNRIMQHG